MIRVIAGLGNPGQKYKKTRHNAGAMILENLVSHFGLKMSPKPISLAEAAETIFEWEEPQEKPQEESKQAGAKMQAKLFLIRPQNYMNLSGKPIANALKHCRANPQDLLVLHDEIDLPLGEMRLKQSGGHRGHNGLRDIISMIGADFSRLRFGVNRPLAKEDVAEYVLSPFFKEEEAQLPALLAKAQSLCLEWLKGTTAFDSR